MPPASTSGHRKDLPNPLIVPELIEHCISYLGDSPRDLQACAVVCRRWVHAAQSHLFRAPTVTNEYKPIKTNEIRWGQFRDVLAISPHLIRHIHSFHVEGLEAYSATLSQICHFPFTHLTSVFISISGCLWEASLLAIEQLLSLPTLRRVKFGCVFGNWADFMQVWARCSPAIRHLELASGVRTAFPSSSPLMTPRTTPLALESLRIESEPDELACCHTELFDPSHLKVLSVGVSSWQKIIASKSFALALETITVLDIPEDFHNSPGTVDISAFPNLALLRIGTTNWHLFGTRPLQILTTISASNSVIRTITLVPTLGPLPSEICEQLDAELSNLPMPQLPMVELEVDASDFDEMSPHFPCMAATNLLRRADSSHEWWMSSRVLEMCGASV
ncbi:hypothetical protein B0H19DRAFT_1137201 [Mycena capillaripes]|nr:hypothetical protein B0H19DRAFT_1137201 [Mycena capillaripes]